MVIGVHRCFGSHLAAGEFDRAVRDHLVGVHVALGAGAGLPDAEGEVGVEFSGDDLVGGADDEVALLGGKFAEIGVGEGAGFFQDAEGFDHREIKEPEAGGPAVVDVSGGGGVTFLTAPERTGAGRERLAGEVDPGGGFRSENPATGTTVAELPCCGAAEIDTAVRSARGSSFGPITMIATIAVNSISSQPMSNMVRLSPFAGAYWGVEVLLASAV